MKINNQFKLFSFMSAVLMVAVIACLSGCVSVHTSSIVAHDSLRFPTVGLESDEVVSEGGFVIKTTPTWSESDEAYTHSVQGGYAHSLVFPLSSKFRVSLAGGISGYYARNFLTGIFEDTVRENKYFDGYGFTGQLKPSIFFGSGSSRFMIGGNFVYNKEFGDYLDFRHTFDYLNTNPYNSITRLDFSPHGQSLSTALHLGYAYSYDKDYAFLAEFGMGVLYTDFIWDNTYRLSTYSGTLTYTGKHFWVWVAGEWFPFLNTGISVGMGLRLR